MDQSKAIPMVIKVFLVFFNHSCHLIALHGPTGLERSHFVFDLLYKKAQYLQARKQNVDERRHCAHSVPLRKHLTRGRGCLQLYL